MYTFYMESYVGELSRLCPETSTKLYVLEFGFRTGTFGTWMAGTEEPSSLQTAGRGPILDPFPVPGTSTGATINGKPTGLKIRQYQ
jgi:hypothetical protein